MNGNVKANFSLSLSCNGIVKKKSFKSIITIVNPAGIVAGEGRPGCKAPMVCIALLMAQRSCINLYFLSPFFLLQKELYSVDYWKAPQDQLLLFVVPKYEPVVIFVLKVATDKPI
jgi:hypothetical protein